MTVVKFAGSTMFKRFKTCEFKSSVRLLAVSVMLVVGHPLEAQSTRAVPVSIYGDGNPENGIEDSRSPIAVSPGKGGSDRPQRMNAGSIVCDGRFRGTAMVVDISELSSDVGGVVLLSAAHVIYNLDKNRRFRQCKFYFMGWKRPSGYGSKIDLKNIRMGNFDPREMTSGADFGEGDWVFLHVPKPWKKYQPGQSIRLRSFEFSNLESFQQSGGEFRLIAFDTVDDVIKQSRNCTVIESGPDDIGGGTWKGQLLDDCDSTDGASGGGILASLDDQQFLIGIRSGSHWSTALFPVDRFPSGPVEGSRWNRHSNTNFGRAIDAVILHEFGQFIQSLKE
ncbi:MAG: hypothetical protein WBN41_08560 [Lysobacterales bacterium]